MNKKLVITFSIIAVLTIAVGGGLYYRQHRPLKPSPTTRKTIEAQIEKGAIDTTQTHPTTPEEKEQINKDSCLTKNESGPCGDLYELRYPDGTVTCTHGTD